MAKKHTEPKHEDPILATTDEAQAVVNSEPENSTQPPAEKQKRRKRTPLEVFQDQKQANADAVANAELAIRTAEDALVKANYAQEKFISDWKKSLGL